MKLAVVGATGMVGNVMLQVLAERNLPVDEYLFVASERSVGKEIQFNNKTYKIIGLQTAVDAQPEIAILSAGGDTSREWAPQFAAVGTTVIDNSSAWRMDETKKLIVPEINAEELTIEDKIIANPNCSTTQMVLALLPLHKRYGIKRLVISTYQSVSGTGVKAIQQMNNERAGKTGEMAYPYPIDMNCLPHGGDFQEDGYTTEEQKLVDETRKILGDNDMAITATVVRVPVSGGHSEAINVELKNDFDLNEVRQLLAQTSGIKVQDNTDVNQYPMPLYAKDKDEVFVGRLRRDFSQPNTLNMWVVADNLRKGAATNAVQIAQYVVEKGLVGSFA
ncbi:MAG: aspartate-semialdehyde dehydrogenase [Flavobacteriales bacterium]|nr:aspartate-semialdehyde dehydrogenase [Flavobacteriales bacterium]